MTEVTEVVAFTGFNDERISSETRKGLEDMGFKEPTPIQVATLPILLGDDTDFIGLAATGTGKTAAFGIPLIEKIDPKIRATQALVLCPTRELAKQVAEQLEKMGKHKQIRTLTIYGGSGYRRQIEGLKAGAHIVVATPGRLVDHIEQGIAALSKIKVVVLDEADEMISMGFKEDLERILKATHPQDETQTGAIRAACKTWLFSATMSSDVRRVADRYLASPKQVAINKKDMLSGTVKQVYYTTKFDSKNEVLCRILDTIEDFYGLIFCTTKMQVAELAERLQARGYPVDSLHGDKTQGEREFTLKKFKARRTTVLVSTDVAARGLDIKDLTHVINYELPLDMDSYVHRIGRTGRSGAQGIAMSIVAPQEIPKMLQIERMTKVAMEKGKIPSATEVATAKLRHMVKKLVDVDTESSGYELATSALENLGVNETANYSGNEILARVLMTFFPEVLSAKEMALDFLGDLTVKDWEEQRRAGRGGRSGPSRGGPRDRFGGGRSFDRGPRSFDRDGGGGRGPRRPFSDEGDRPPRREFNDERPQRSFGRNEGRGENRGEGRNEGRFDDRGPRPERSGFDRSAGSDRSERPARFGGDRPSRGGGSRWVNGEKVERAPRANDSGERSSFGGGERPPRGGSRGGAGDRGSFRSQRLQQIWDKKND